ncbi:unnamed protein product [Aphanomyces euteiches]
MEAATRADATVDEIEIGQSDSSHTEHSDTKEIVSGTTATAEEQVTSTSTVSTNDETTSASTKYDESAEEEGNKKEESKATNSSDSGSKNEASDGDTTVSTPKGRGRKAAPVQKIELADGNGMAEQLLELNEKLPAEVKGMYGRVVWAQMRGYPYWPGYVCDPTMLTNDYESMKIFLPQIETHYWVYFYDSDNRWRLNSDMSMTGLFSAAIPYTKVAPWEDTSKPYRTGYFPGLPANKKSKLISQTAKMKPAIELAEREQQLPSENRIAWVLQKVEIPELKPLKKSQQGKKREGDDNEDGPPKKRRGRPPKKVEVPQQLPDEKTGEEDVNPPQQKKKRGRPPKVKPQEAAQEDIAVAEPSPKQKGKPGRKPKVKVEEEEVAGESKRPDNTKSPADAEEEPKKEPKRRGRPPKKQKPPVTEEDKLEETNTPPEPKKRRGRPPKSAASKQSVGEDTSFQGEAQENNTKELIPEEAAPVDKSDVKSTAQKGKGPDVIENEATEQMHKGKKDEKEKKINKKRKLSENDDSSSKTQNHMKQKHNADGKVKTNADDKKSEENVEKRPKSNDDLWGQDGNVILDNFNVDKAKRVSRKLAKCARGDSKESFERALQIMNCLFELKEFSLEMLKESGLPPVVNQLRGSSNPNVAKTASALRKHMMQQSGFEKSKAKAARESTETTPAPSAPVESAPVEEPKAKVTPQEDATSATRKCTDQEPDNVTTPEGDDSSAQFGRDREMVIQMLQSIIASPKVSREIETALFDRFSDTTEEYKTQARRVIFGLRDHELCRQKVLSGSLHVLELVFATDEAFTQYNMAPWKAK